MNKLWFIICYLLMRLRQIERDTNELLNAMEVEANERLKELAQKQVELDQVILNTWEDNVRQLWAECQQLRAENEKLRERLNKELRY